MLVTLDAMVAWGTCRRGNSIAAIMNPGVSLARQYAPRDAELIPICPPATSPTNPQSVALYRPAICSKLQAQPLASQSLNGSEAVGKPLPEVHFASSVKPLAT